MRLIYAGTPEFAERALDALIDAGHEVALVLTRADRPAGRGQHLQASPVKQRALRSGIEVFQPATLRDPAAQARLAQVQADVMVVAAYGLILPQAVLDLPRLGCLNIHASLLPRWRGAAPIQRAIEAGDRQTGVTIMQMEAGLDTGPMLLCEAVPIGPEDNAAVVHDALAALGARLIVQALQALDDGGLTARVQPEAGVTYAHKLDKAEAALDWRLPASQLHDRIRAFDPFPGCTGAWRSEAGRPEAMLKIWAARIGPEGAGLAPGQVRIDEAGVLVGCGEGCLRLLTVQKPGGRRMAALEFIRGQMPVMQTMDETSVYCQVGFRV